MTLKQALNLLKYYNKWRRGEDIEQPNPKLIGEAIDIAIDIMSQLNKKTS